MRRWTALLGATVMALGLPDGLTHGQTATGPVGVWPKDGAVFRLSPGLLGGAYNASYLRESETRLFVEEQPLPPRNESRLTEMRIKIDKPDQQGAQKVALSFTRVKESTIMDGQELSYDSANVEKPSDTWTQSRTLFAATVFSASVGPHGQVENVSADNVKLTEADKANTQAMKQLEYVGQTLLSQTVLRAQRLWPEGGHKVGDKWEAVEQIVPPYLGTLNFRQICTLKAVEKAAKGNVAVIDIAGQAKKNEPIAGPKGQVDEMNLDFKGQARIDLEAGMLQSLQWRQSVEAKLSNVQIQGTELRKNVRMKLQSSESVTLDAAQPVVGKSEPSTRPPAAK